MDLDTIGKRLTYCRSLLGLSRQNLIKAMNEFTIKTLFRWESGQVKISQNKLDKLINFFITKDLIVNKEWVYFGKGAHPLNNNLLYMQSYNFDEIAYMSLNYTQSYIKNLEIYQINSTFFEPILHFGDYIGGILINDLSNIAGKLCFVVIDGTVSIGLFDHKNNQLTNIHGTILKLIKKHFEIGLVIWMTKRF